MKTAPIEIQLAIQGGGAKIVALMAVLDALEKLSTGDAPRFKVTRIVGTSAGALAGAFFASGVGIESLIKEWGGGKLQHIQHALRFPVSRVVPRGFFIAHCLMKKDPVWPSAVIEKYLHEVLNRGEQPVSDFASLKSRREIEVVSIRTNLRDRRTEATGMESIVATSLMDSAGLPYFLRKWHDGDSPVIVDGGIGENLPAARLSSDPRPGLPICISFRPRVNPGSNPRNFNHFSLALLDAAIEVSTQHAARSVPLTHFIDTTITTFGFDEAIQAIGSMDSDVPSHYKELRSKALQWFEELYDREKQKEKERAVSDSVTILHPWQTDDLVAKGLMKDVWLAITRQFQNQLFTFHSVELRGILDHLKDASKPDTVTYAIEFEPGVDPLYCYWMGVSDGVRAELTQEPEIKVIDVESGEFVPHVRVPAIDPEFPEGRDWIIFFTPALLKGRKYRLTQTEIGKKLFQWRRDETSKAEYEDLGFDPNRVLGAIGVARLVLDIPTDIQKTYKIIPRNNIQAEQLRLIAPWDLPRLGSAQLNGYETTVCEGSNVKGPFVLDVILR